MNKSISIVTFFGLLILWLTGSTVAEDGAVENRCGSANPVLGFGLAPYGGSWATDHRDGRNSDFADCEVGGDGYEFTFSVRAEELHTHFVYPVIGPDGTVWITVALPEAEGPCPVQFCPSSSSAIYLYGANIHTGEVTVKLGANDGLNLSVNWNQAVIDKDGNIYLGQERNRRRGTTCRFHEEALTRDELCGEYFSYDPQGNLRWKVRTDGATLGSQLTSDGKIIFQTWRGTIYVLAPDVGVPRRSRILSATNSFPVAAATLPDGDVIRKIQRCMSKGTNDSCISGNIIAIHPETDAIYNTVQGFVIGLSGSSFIQRWLYDPVTHGVQLDQQWIRATELPGGSATSPDISFDGDTIFVNDFEGSVYAFNAITGELLHFGDISFPPAGSTATAPEVDANGGIIGTFLTFYGPWTQDVSETYVTVMRYRDISGFETIKVYDGSESGVGWRITRNPIGGLVDKTAVDVKVRFLVMAEKVCGGCENDGKYFLLVIEPETGAIVSETKLWLNRTGLMALAPDRSVIVATKGRPQSPGALVLPLFQRYDAVEGSFFP